MTSAPGDTGASHAGLLAIASALAGLLNYAYALVLSYELPPAQYSVFVGCQSLVVINGVIGSVGVPFVVARQTRIAIDRADDRLLTSTITFAFWAKPLPVTSTVPVVPCTTVVR